MAVLLRSGSGGDALLGAGVEQVELAELELELEPAAERRHVVRAQRGDQGVLAAAAVHGRVGIDSFDESWLCDPRIADLASRVVMHVDEEIGSGAPPLTQALVSVRLRSGRVVSMRANGARGYPEQPASAEELEAKFRANAERACAPDAVEAALAALARFDELPDVRRLTALLAHARSSETTSGQVTPLRFRNPQPGHRCE